MSLSAEDMDSMEDGDWDEYAFEKMDGGLDDDDFADPGGTSALRASSPTNPRNKPCPDCGGKNLLTPKDVQLGYCCDRCADRNESGFGY